MIKKNRILSFGRIDFEHYKGEFRIHGTTNDFDRSRVYYATDSADPIFHPDTFELMIPERAWNVCLDKSLAIYHD